MDGDLYIDNAMLQRVRTNLGRIAELLERPANSMERVDIKAMGAAELEKRMDSFGNEWSYGIKQLSKFSGTAVKALDRIEEKFAGLDSELAEQLSGVAKKK